MATNTANTTTTVVMTNVNPPVKLLMIRAGIEKIAKTAHIIRSFVSNSTAPLGSKDVCPTSLITIALFAKTPYLLTQGHKMYRSNHSFSIQAYPLPVHTSKILDYTACMDSSHKDRLISHFLISRLDNRYLMELLKSCCNGYGSTLIY